MQWIANQLTGWAVNVLAGFTNMIGAFIMACLAALIGLAGWHRRRIKAGERGLEPSHLILIGLVGVFVASGVGLVGFAWQIKRGGLAHMFEQDSPKATAQAAANNDPGAVVTTGPGSSDSKTKIGSILGKNPPRAIMDHGKGNNFDVGIVSDGSVPAPPPDPPPPWPGTQFSKLSNTKLKARCFEMATKMRTIESETTRVTRPAYNRMMNAAVSDPDKLAAKIEWDQTRDKMYADFNEKVRGDAAALIAEVLARQNILPPYSSPVRLMYPGALQGQFAGPNPIASAANFIEDRARMLPDG